MAELSMTASTIAARLAAGDLKAATPTEIRTLLNVEDGADVTDGTNVLSALATPGADVIINEGGLDVDTRLESDTQANKLMIDAGLNLLQTRPGTSASGFAQLSGILHADTTSDGTPASTSRTLLKRYTLPANALQNDGDAITYLMAGVTAANANTKQLEIEFDGVVIYDSTAIAANNTGWVTEGTIFRSGSATAHLLGRYGIFNGGAILAGFNKTASTPTWSGAVNLDVYGTNGTATANDLTCDLFQVKYEPSS